jgi:hypothetical protein
VQLHRLQQVAPCLVQTPPPDGDTTKLLQRRRPGAGAGVGRTLALQPQRCGTCVEVGASQWSE